MLPAVELVPYPSLFLPIDSLAVLVGMIRLYL